MDYDTKVEIQSLVKKGIDASNAFISSEEMKYVINTLAGDDAAFAERLILSIISDIGANVLVNVLLSCPIIQNIGIDRTLKVLSKTFIDQVNSKIKINIESLPDNISTTKH